MRAPVTTTIAFAGADRMDCRKNSGHTTRRPAVGTRSWLAFVASLLMAAGATGPAAAQKNDPKANPFPGRFPAPSLEGGVEWLNTSGEISLKELRGKIVILDFWTYCCINCMHVLPDLKYLEHKYPNELVVIGVHYAKFSNEKETENIRRAILRYEIEHPVVNDANGVIAEQYQFRSWPTLVVIDPDGNYVGSQPGEGTRELMDTVIGKLVEFHRGKGTLDETPVKFILERDRAQAGPLKFPGKLLVDQKNDRLYVSDSNHNRIVISTLEGQLVDVIGTGALGAKNGKYTEATFDHPQGMTLVDDTLYIADTENHLIRKVDLDQKVVSTLAGTGEQARTRVPGGVLRETALNSPWAITYLDGALYIAMAGPHQLWSHTLGTSRIGVFAGTGQEDILDGPREDCALAQPSGITTDGKRLYHVDSEGSAVRSVAVDRGGAVTTIAGAHDLPRGRNLFEFGDIDGKGNDARLQHPLGIVYHDKGLFVADTYNHKIKHVEIDSREVTTWLGSGNRGLGLDPVELSEPSDVAIAGGRMLIADTNNHRILSVDLETKRAEAFVIAGLQPPVESGVIERPEPTAELAKISEQAIAPAEALKIRLAFRLPEGFKLNKLAPQTCRITASGDQSLISPDNLSVKHEAEIIDDAAVWTIPLAAKSGGGTFELKVAYAYCRDGTGGVCRFDTARWEVPIRLAPDATEQAISLTVEPSSK
jgi:thiol-disulfide isomerase/thioredoxin